MKLRHLWLIIFGMACASAAAQIPDRPVITEIFNNPTGSDGPTARDLTNPEQEYVEVYLPDVSNLAASLQPYKDALRITYYEIEGDSGNSEIGYVNQRVDLPPFDLDASNGVQVGSVARPASGVLVLGWVDYTPYGGEPTDLAGDPGSRIGLINNGITSSPPGTEFIAVNGNQFGGTTNFVTPVAESLIDVPNENVSGFITNGSNIFMIVNRDDPGYAQLEDRANGSPSDGMLPSGTVLGLSALLDGIAGNDDSQFVEADQPYVSPTGSDIDLEVVLPAGSVFANWIAQVDEASGGGYARRFVDVPRTTEDGISGNEDPAADAIGLYRNIFRSGPFLPTPASVTFSTSPPELGVALASRLGFDVIAGTTGRPALISANVGGDFPMDITTSPGSSSNPSAATFASDAPALAVPGQTVALPRVAVTAAAGAADGAIAESLVTFTAMNSMMGDPAVVNPLQVSTATATVLNPTTGLDAGGSPLETTIFAAVQGFGADAGVPNEFVASDLATFISNNLGGIVGGSFGNSATLLNIATDLEDIEIVDPLRQSFPATEVDFINAAGISGDLVNTVLNSAKVVSGSSTYAGSINTSQTGIRAIELNIPETATSGGTFSPSEFLYFADAAGAVFDSERSGLSNVTTDRTFEVAIIDTNTTNSGIESGNADDFGIIVEVGQTASGASVSTGEFVFLSYTGGLEGEDIDSVDVPEINATVAILLDLDNLEDILGCETITRLFVVDAGGSGTLNIVEAYSLNGVDGPDCGDGAIDDSEECDNGVANTDAPGTPGVTCRTNCTLAGCGDGITDFGESCDDANTENTDACLNTCETAICGDGFVQSGLEHCDEGASNSDTAPDACRTNCVLPSCGDGVIDTGETCDDGNATNGDGCSDSCVVEVSDVSCTRDCDCYFDAVDNGTPFDVCDYHYCDGGFCTSCPRRWGNTCDSYTGFVQTDDILCAVTGFGNYCACPNGDLIGSGNSKGPSGSPLGTDDILAIVAAFGGANPFACPVPGSGSGCDAVGPPDADGCGPAAASMATLSALTDQNLLTSPHTSRSVDAPVASFAMVPRQRAIHAGEQFEVDVFVTDVDSLVGFEFGMTANGDRTDQLVLESVFVNSQRRDFVFHGLTNFPATDKELGRVGGAVMDAGVTIPQGKRAYLGTFVFDVPADTSGSVTLQPLTEFIALYPAAGEQFVAPVDDVTIIVVEAGSRR